MKIIVKLLISFVLFISLCSCDSAQSAINDLENLVTEVELNYESYTQEDWESIESSYEAINYELEQYTYTSEQQEKIGRLQGKFIGITTKASVEGVFDQLPKILGGIGGFIEEVTPNVD